MEEQLADLYAVVFFSAIIVLASFEALWPRRALTGSLRMRWVGNIGVTMVGALLLRALLPLTAIGFAHVMEQRGWGLLNVVTLPAAASVVAAFLLLDLARYLTHVLMHHNAFLWRLHRLHHTDQDVDFTTEFRVHPLELLFGACSGFLVVALIGPPVMALVIFNILFAAQAFWTHSNIAFPSRLDRWLRLVFTTPDVHRIHHSVDLRESNSNLGAMFTWWDRLFGTFVEQPARGHERMELGVAEFRDPKHMSLPWMLVDPFLHPQQADAGGAPPLKPETPVAS